jgi:hypothetical protein
VEVSFIKKFVIFCTVALVLFLILLLNLSQIHRIAKEQQSPAMCWEKFKMEKCDVDQPGSRLCQELLECSTKETK